MMTVRQETALSDEMIETVSMSGIICSKTKAPKGAFYFGATGN